MAYLVTGGCGFVGANLASELILREEDVLLLDNLTRPGTQANLAWLSEVGKFDFHRADVRCFSEIETIFRKCEVNCVFHLAGQVAMTSSLENPREDFEINALGSINVLECVRLFSPKATVVFASTNKVYGGLDETDLAEGALRYEPIGKKEIDERARLELFTPYACSKGSADQYMLEYARNFSLNTVVFRHSTIYGGRQISTFDQGWVGWFCQKALDTLENPDMEFTINGNGKQVRDLLHVSDAVACYLAAHENVLNARGEAFNIGGGYENSMSLRELFACLEEKLGVKMNPQELPWRANDQKYFVADNSKAEKRLAWKPKVTKEKGIADAIAWERSRRVIGKGL